MAAGQNSPHRDPRERPACTAAELHAQIRGTLSLPARMGYLALLLVSLTVTALVGALWATEPELPPRTHAAFGVLVLVGATWAAVAGYILTRRRPLFATDRVLATATAVAATVVVGTGTTVLSLLRGGIGAGLGAAALATVTVGLAAVLHVRARRLRSALIARRRQLEGQRDRRS